MNLLITMKQCNNVTIEYYNLFVSWYLIIGYYLPTYRQTDIAMKQWNNKDDLYIIQSCQI